MSGSPGTAPQGSGGPPVDPGPTPEHTVDAWPPPRTAASPDGRRRNLSPWAFWMLHLSGVGDADPCPTNPAEVTVWRERVRGRLDELLGAPPSRVPLDIELTQTVDAGDHLRHRIVFDSEATMAVPAYLLVPKERVTAPAGTAVLAVHGHGPGKEMICGLTGPEQDHYALELVRMGHVVLAPDLRCFGERQDPQWDPSRYKYDCDWNLVAATMADTVPLAQNLWDLHRSIDVLEGHPLVDPARIAVVGFSYGATMSLFCAATDTRVRAAVLSGYLSSWRSTHTVPWNMCGSQVLPGQLGRLEHLDLAALVAPRPLLVESGTEDILFPADTARETVGRLREVYRALGADPALVVHDVFEGDHRWHGSMVRAFLTERLEAN